MISAHLCHIPATYTPLPLCKKPTDHHPSDLAAAACWSPPWDSQRLCGLSVHSEMTHSGLHFRNRLCSALLLLCRQYGEGGHSSFWEGRWLIVLWVNRSKKGLACSWGLPSVEEDCEKAEVLADSSPGPGGGAWPGEAMRAHHCKPQGHKARWCWTGLGRYGTRTRVEL